MKPREGQLEAVLFDLGGTLVHPSNAEIPSIMQRILHAQGIHRTLNEITHAWKAAEKQLDFRDLARLLDDFWVLWNRKILRNLQVDSPRSTLPHFIATHWWEYAQVTLYPDAAKILPDLKARRLKVGLVSNGLQSDIDQILPKVNLQDFFDIVVVIDTLRKMKPDIEVFQHALQQLKTTPSNAIFIGDDLKADYHGAQNAGLTAYLINRRGNTHNDNVNTITTLDDLFTLNIIK
jgi:2-haloalkanoic acid dehalogenase type II